MAHVIAACENRLITKKVIDRSFSTEEIQGGILKKHLTMDDYRAPLEVSIIPHSLTVLSAKVRVIQRHFTIS